jgi:hypothetical protein
MCVLNILLKGDALFLNKKRRPPYLLFGMVLNTNNAL